MFKNNDAEQGRAWFTFLLGLPALIGWAAYGLAWLLAPRLPLPVDPLAWAGFAVGCYYSILAFIALGLIEVRW